MLQPGCRDDPQELGARKAVLCVVSYSRYIVPFNKTFTTTTHVVDVKMVALLHATADVEPLLAEVGRLLVISSKAHMFYWYSVYLNVL